MVKVAFAGKVILPEVNVFSGVVSLVPTVVGPAA
jgi:hypothetical protein